MGREDELEALILLALGRVGQQRAAVETGSNPYLPAISKALNRNTVRGFFVSENPQLLFRCFPVSGLNPNQQLDAVQALDPIHRPMRD